VAENPPDPDVTVAENPPDPDVTVAENPPDPDVTVDQDPTHQDPTHQDPPHQDRPDRSGHPDDYPTDTATGDPDTGPGTDPVTRDRRTRAQQLLHALIDCTTLAARHAHLPHNGGLPPQLLITMNLTDLQHNTGTAHLPHTGTIPITQIRKTACDAGIIPLVLGSHSEILDLGRTQRTLPTHLRRALHTRDQGCTFPNCTRPTPWTEAHHIQHWADGGPTTLNNTTLLCSYHHHLIHRTNWTITLHHNTPWYTPPATLDPTQTPRRNTYHHP
jgi:hypothetical protein